MEGKSATELSAFLEDKGIPHRFCEAFKNNFVDGAVLCRLTEQEIREIVPPIGLAKKIHSFFPKHLPDPLAVDPERLQSMDTEDLVQYLHVEHDIPLEYCDKIEENYIDGESFFKLSETDVKEILPPLGLWKKIVQLIGIENSSKEDTGLGCPSTHEMEIQVPQGVLFSRSPSLISIPDTATSSAGTSVNNDDVVIPDHWRPEVEKCIKDHALNPDARNEIVRKLVSLLYTKQAKVTRADCEKVSKRLILKYPFMKDGLGCGYLSWTDKMIERVRNVVKADKRKAKKSGSAVALSTTPTKRQRKDVNKDHLLRRYPTTQNNLEVEDDQSIEQHKRAIAAELSRTKPRDVVLLPLLKSTFGERRTFIITEANSVREIRDRYPAMHRPLIMEQEFNLIIDRSNTKKCFISEWHKYAAAIISYGQVCRKRSIDNELLDLDLTDEKSHQVVALKILGRLFCYRMGKSYLDAMYKEYKGVTVIMEDILKDEYLSPRIATYPRSNQFFVVTEKFTLCHFETIEDALFYLFASYYAYNLEYPQPVKSLFYFFQDFVVNYPDSHDRNSTYLSVISDIKQHL